MQENRCRNSRPEISFGCWTTAWNWRLQNYFFLKKIDHRKSCVSKGPLFLSKEHLESKVMDSERNQRLHNSISPPPRIIFKQLDRFIKDAIWSKRNLKHYGNLMQDWLRNEWENWNLSLFYFLPRLILAGLLAIVTTYNHASV